MPRGIRPFQGITRVAQQPITKSFKGPASLPRLTRRAVQCYHCVKSGLICETSAGVTTCISCRIRHDTTAHCNWVPQDPAIAAQAATIAAQITAFLDAYEDAVARGAPEDELADYKTDIDISRSALSITLPNTARRVTLAAPAPPPPRPSSPIAEDAPAAMAATPSRTASADSASAASASVAALTAIAGAALERIKPEPSVTPDPQVDRAPTPASQAGNTPVDYSYYDRETGIYYPGSAPTPCAYPSTPYAPPPWTPFGRIASPTPRPTVQYDPPPAGSNALVNWALDRRIKRLEKDSENMGDRRARARYIRCAIYDEVDEVLQEKLEESVDRLLFTQHFCDADRGYGNEDGDTVMERDADSPDHIRDVPMKSIEE